MKHSTIKDLFYEKVGTLNSIKANKICLELSSKLIKLEKEILEKCGENIAKLLNEYFDLQTELEGEIIDHYYIEGFKIGACVAFECAEKRE